MNNSTRRHRRPRQAARVAERVDRPAAPVERGAPVRAAADQLPRLPRIVHLHHRAAPAPFLRARLQRLHLVGRVRGEDQPVAHRRALHARASRSARTPGRARRRPHRSCAARNPARAPASARADGWRRYGTTCPKLRPDAPQPISFASRTITFAPASAACSAADNPVNPATDDRDVGARLALQPRRRRRRPRAGAIRGARQMPRVLHRQISHAGR